MIHRNFDLKQFTKSFFWLGALISGVVCLYLSYKSPEIFTALIIGILIFLCIKNKLHYGIYIILLLPVLGELSRISILGQDRGFIASDLIIPIFILIWLFYKKSSFNLPTTTRKIFITAGIFIFIATLSLLLSLLSLPLKEVIFSSLYLIRFIEYAMLFPITVNLLSPSIPSYKTSIIKNPTEILQSEEISSNPKSFTLNKLIKFLTFSALLIALGGFIQLIIYPDLEKLVEIGYDPHINRLVGTWLDPNFIGGFFAFIICIFIGIALHSKNTKVKIFYLISSLVMAIALFLTYSRSAYLALCL